MASAPSMCLSPRVRGNRLRRCGHRAAGVSIPACAGEPPSLSDTARAKPVYPRVCGGTGGRRVRRWCTTCLSPRVRGNRPTIRGAQGLGVSIPACAGEPTPRPARTIPSGVYPRVCGGTRQPDVRPRHWHCLSPRVRGNHFRWRNSPPPPEMSIPACAGEPLYAHPPSRALIVYPRVCGGTLCCPPFPRGGVCLSPRVRGNPALAPISDIVVVSIPACAGEPAPGTVSVLHAGVYPRVCGGTRGGGPDRDKVGCLSRVCGGTLTSTPTARRLRCLSPRVRGNPGRSARPCTRTRSIPACAGEPSSGTAARRYSRVYPRVCGGTSACRRCSITAGGLSPRVRGNRRRSARPAARPGSIPACAGEPRCPSVPGRRGRVYPRVCGGTSRGTTGERTRKGLSPRVRGNRLNADRNIQFRRSIPACAGEPGTALTPHFRQGVYPRVCGGTRSARGWFPLRGGLSPRVRGNPVKPSAP